MRDLLQCIFQRMRIGVHRVNAPGVTGAVVRGLADAVDGRVAQVDVRRGDVDFRAQHHRALGVLAGTHFTQTREGFRAGAVAPRSGAAGLGQRAAVGAHFLRALFIHIGVARGDQVFRRFIHEVEIVTGEIQVRAPVKTQPLHRILDRVDVFLLFLFRIGVVEAQVAGAAVMQREAKIQADRFGVAQMQVAVGFRREAGADFRRIRERAGMARRRSRFAAPSAAGVMACGEVGFDMAADEIRGGCCRFGAGLGCFGHAGKRLLSERAFYP